MKKLLKKSLAVILATVIVLCAMPFTAAAESYSGTCGENLTWSLETETGVLEIRGTGAMWDWAHTMENAPWKDYSEYIEVVDIDYGVTTIGIHAFDYCNNLRSVTISDSVTKIGRFAFQNCESLTDITIPFSVTVVEDSAFMYCTNLIDIQFPDSIIELGSNPLGQTGYSKDLNNWENGVLYNGKHIVDADRGIEGTYSVKEGTLTIAENAFMYCDDLVSVAIPKSITTIDKWTFAYCTSLLYVEIPDSVTTVRDFAFYYCENLDYIHIPQNVVELGEYVLGFTSAYICSASEECYAKTYAEENKIEFRLCTEHDKESHPKVTDDKSGIELEYDGDDYSGEVGITVTESFDGAAFQLVNTQTNALQSFICDVTMTVDGVAVQPSGKVTVRIPLPEGYDPTRTFVYHIDTATGKVEPMYAEYTDGFLVFETDHFSYYAVVQELGGEIKINVPSINVVNYGDTLVLSLGDVEIPEGYKVMWFVEGAGFTTQVSEDGKECRVTSTANGGAVISAKLVDAESEETVKDYEENEFGNSITLTSKVGFFQMLISFFKNLFGLNRIIY